MIDPQIKRGVTRDEYTRRTRIVWRLYYFTNAQWVIAMTWTCATRAEARWFAFTHQWLRIGGTAAGVDERSVGHLIAQAEVIP